MLLRYDHTNPGNSGNNHPAIPFKKEKNMKRAIAHYILIPAVLIGSDLFIGFMGHYSGTTGNDYSFEAFMDYLTHLSPDTLFPILFIALIVVAIIEIFIKRGG
jgi:hypothetical protein